MLKNRKWLICFIIAGIYITLWAVPVMASFSPGIFGADWEFNQFSKSFSKSLKKEDDNAKTFFYGGLAMIAVLFMGYGYLREEQAKRQIQTKREQITKQKEQKSANEPQRRDWLRVFSSLDASYLLDTPQSNKELVPTRILDLGAGGCKLEVFEKMEQGDSIKVVFSLSPEETLAMTGQVQRIMLSPKQEGDPYNVGVQFLDVKEAERDQIVRWVYKNELNISEEKKRLAEGLCLGCGKPVPREPGTNRVPPYCPKCEVYGKNE